MRKVALIVNTDKPIAIDAGAAMIKWLESRSIQPIIQPEAARVIHRPDLAIPPGPHWEDAELMIVFGGDGTLIRAAQMAAPMRIPILGVNTGHLGFLTEIENVEVFEHLDPILNGHFLMEERLMLTAQVWRGGKLLLEVAGLNDAVVSKGPRARLVHLGVSVGETPVASYPADGIVVATPTGSTAYSLSAGGPIVGPTVDVLLVTPICPHTMISRAMVVAGSERVSITVLENPGEVGLSVDGSDPFPLAKGDLVLVSRAPYNAKLVRQHSYQFYEVLRKKLAHPER